MTYTASNLLAHQEKSYQACIDMTRCSVGAALAISVAITSLFVFSAPLYATIIAYAAGAIWISLAVAATIKALYHLSESRKRPTFYSSDAFSSLESKTDSDSDSSV